MLLIVFLYWQVVPLLMAATGASLDLRKLQVYPIPVSQLFSIEVMLRVTAGIEMMLILSGIAVGIAAESDTCRNGARSRWCPTSCSICFWPSACATSDAALMARKRIRELVVFLLVMCTALPQLTRSPREHGGRSVVLFARDSWSGWPWARPRISRRAST